MMDLSRIMLSFAEQYTEAYTECIQAHHAPIYGHQPSCGYGKCHHNTMGSIH